MPPRDVIQRFLAAAGAAPSHPAVRLRAGDVSYGDLLDHVRRFATGLGVRPAPRVLVALPQGADAYAAMLAAGLAGGYYVPVNLSAPVDKLRRIIRLAAPDVVVVDAAALSADLSAAIGEAAAGAPVLDVAALRQAPPFAGDGIRHEIAYVIFTSGSTGVPKGVVIPRAGLDHYIAWATETLGLGPDDRVSQHPNIGFDLSVLDIYGALCSGATLCPVVGAGDRLMPARLVAERGMTVWISVPSVVGLMLQARQAVAAWLASVRLFFFCGEPLLREHVEAIFAACPEATVVNTYGPTEATVSMTYLPLRAGGFAEACAASVALGEAIPGTALHLVGGRHADEGEIVIAGAQLALGYWRDPERTAQAFRTVDVAGQPVRGYCTGDWAERRGGFLFFKERIDFQVKVRGFRVELDEVASAIRDCGWPSACVFKRGEALAAVVEARDDTDFEPAALQAALAARLDAYAIPTEIRAIGKMPRNANDKLDREAVALWFDASPTPLAGGADV